MSTIYDDWLQAKEAERLAVNARREVEDKLLANLALPKTFEGSKTIKDGGYQVKVTARMNRKIDGDALQEIAAEHGISEHLGSLFRWKPDINARQWKAANESITRPLMDAITTTPGRPSFAITKED